MRILITGSRHWDDTATVEWALDLVVGPCLPGLPDMGAVTVVHGGSLGADTIAHAIATDMGAVTEVHPADWQRYGRGAGPRRNAAMVALGADVVCAFPLGASPGTRGCMALAESAGLRVITFSPHHADLATPGPAR